MSFGFPELSACQVVRLLRTSPQHRETQRHARRRRPKAYLDTPYFERSEACERIALMALRALSGRRTTAEMYDTFERLACSLELDLREVA
jgi:hypothetical protein